MEKVTVVIPTFNSEKYIYSLIEKLKKVNNVKFILIDDGSKDDTAKILKSIRDERFKILLNNHKGVSFTRNLGIKLCDTKYISFIDSDDMIDVSVFQKIVDGLNTETMYDVISIGKNFERHDYFELDKINLTEQLLMLKRNIDILPGPTSKMYRTSFLKVKKILFPNRIVVGEDMLFNIEVIGAATSLRVLSTSFYLYRNNLDSVTRKQAYNVESNQIAFLNQLQILLKRTLLKEDFSKIFQTKLISSWIEISYITFSNNHDIYKLNNLRNHFIPKIKFSQLVSNNMRMTKKVFGILIWFRLYLLIKILFSFKRVKGKRTKTNPFILI